MVADRLKTGETVTAMVVTKKSQDPSTGVEKTFHNIVGLSDPTFDAAAEQLDIAMPGTKQANELPPAPPGLDRATDTSLGRNPRPVAVDMVDVRKTTLMAAAIMLAHGVITPKQMNKTTLEFERYVLNGADRPGAKAGIDVTDFVE
jgi:hypothetical protein